MCGCGITESLVSIVGNSVSCFGNVAFELTLGSCRKIGDRPGLQITKVIGKTIAVAAIVGIISSYASFSPVIPVTLVGLATFRYLIEEEYDWWDETQMQKSLVTEPTWYNQVLSKIFENPYDSV